MKTANIGLATVVFSFL